MHRLTTSFVLGYHGCDREVGEHLLSGADFKASENDYDWLGPGIYFWEANPLRGLEFARESMSRRDSIIEDPFVVGAVVELGNCLDLSTSLGLARVRIAYEDFLEVSSAADIPTPRNSKDHLRRPLDCAVIRRLHELFEEQGMPPIDTIKGVFTEGDPLYAGSGFREKTHVQIAVRNAKCIKGVFRVPDSQLFA